MGSESETKNSFERTAYKYEDGAALLPLHEVSCSPPAIHPSQSNASNTLQPHQNYSVQNHTSLQSCTISWKMRSTTIAAGLSALSAMNIAAALPVLKPSQILDQDGINIIQSAQSDIAAPTISDPQRTGRVALAFGDNLPWELRKTHHLIVSSAPVAMPKTSAGTSKLDNAARPQYRDQKGSLVRREDGDCVQTEDGDCAQTEDDNCVQTDGGDCVQTEDGESYERAIEPENAERKAEDSTSDIKANRDGLTVSKSLVQGLDASSSATRSAALKPGKAQMNPEDDCIDTPDGPICERHVAGYPDAQRENLIEDLIDAFSERSLSARSKITRRTTTHAKSAAEKEKECIDTPNGRVCAGDPELFEGGSSIGDCKEWSIGC